MEEEQKKITDVYKDIPKSPEDIIEEEQEYQEKVEREKEEFDPYG